MFLVTRLRRHTKRCLVFVFACVMASHAHADSSSPLLAAYYDRQMAIMGDKVYAWRGNDTPKHITLPARQVGVGRDTYFVLASNGELMRFSSDLTRRNSLMKQVIWFAAGQSGVLAINAKQELWWIESSSWRGRKIASDVLTAAVGDGANYYVTRSGALYVKGAAHRGQYGDGRLKSSPNFVKTATGTTYVSAHTGHAILLKKNGNVLGTGGNIYGPVGKHGLGDKAIKWSHILSGVRAIATGSSHSLAIRMDGALMAWGSDYGPEPITLMYQVQAVAAGSYVTIILKEDGTLWRMKRGSRRTVQLPIK